MKSNRKGIALLWVMLVSALIFVAILGISMRVVPQKKIENSREYAQRALAVAESGMADTTYKLRKDTALKSTLQSLSSGQSYDSDYVPYNSGAATTGQNDSTYRVIVKKTAAGYTFYSLGTVYSRSGVYTSPSSTVEPTAAPVARQAITVQYSGSFPIGEYGLLTQTSIHMQGGSIQGNVYATDVIMGNKNGTGTPPTFVQSFAAYAPVQGGTITGVPPGEYAYVSAINVPKLTTTSFETYRGYWNDFLKGTGFYDGSAAHVAAGYPNTLTPAVNAWITTTLGVTSGPANQSSKVGNTTFGFDVFFSAIQVAVKSGVTSSPAGYLGTFLSKGTMVYDIQPSASDKPVDLGSSYASAPFLEGTVLIEGDLQLDGGAQIGVDPSKTAILVTGTVNVSAGQSTLNGLLYIDSFDSKALSIKATGGLSVTGSIVAQGGIDLGSNGLSVSYHQNDIYDAEVKGNGLNPVPSSWRQISYDAFSLMQ